MITQNNFVSLLEFLGFARKNSVYSKTVGTTYLSVDVAEQAIHYPKSDGLVVNDRQICNFLANENFVVFECVHRLLEKGYKPDHIELEPKWKLGHGSSGGRADILVKDNLGNPLLIIECKTAGGEFTKAWNKTRQDGDQLFSYAQQISETQFLCLYSSDFENAKLTYDSHVIAHRDNQQYLVANPNFKPFHSATDVKDRFRVWRDTYKLAFTTQGIFEENIQPYQIGKDKYSLADLHAVSASDQQKKYHEFATILRQHNVSGRENAFDKLVNLFLCKLVDEIENPEDLKFYWKGVAYDSHFDLMDRLQQLYQSGMDKFLGEDITYINQDDVSNALRFIRQNPDATQRAVWNLFIQQKFFTNNDFSFIDVHNERLFYQNAEVLLKILQMWQNIRLTNPNGHNQFLGDMFEGFLDQGVKQSEGQYFTPLPICRFILMSLPLESLIRDNPNPPMAIDYACGAGHFLTELALQLHPLLEQYKPQAKPADYHKSIVGIEKEYRLSKVAKVSAFMYGQQDIQICFGDALVNQHVAFPDIRDGGFDLLVANPPYSVRGFLETLPEEERKAYTLTNTISDAETANTIETFFVERAKQLLKPRGVAAIILPSSILSNGSSTYVRVRELLLQYFDIVSIAEFGSGTFGKTGTNTVTLFLRRKPTQPDAAEHYRERLEEWFSADEHQDLYRDTHLILEYCTHINVPLADYKTLLRGEAQGAWSQQEYFQVYHAKFMESAELAKLRKQKKFQALSEDEQMRAIAGRYLAFVQTAEREKLYYFVMASDQTNPVLIIRSPSDSKAMKKFLGYEWSSAKGDEGIKLFEDATGKHLTLLYDGPDHANPMQFSRSNTDKLNRLITANYEGALGTVPAELGRLVEPARLVDMLDFSRATFEKQLSLSAWRAVTIKSKWPLVRLDTVAHVQKGTSITQKKATPGPYKVVAGGTVSPYTHYRSNRPANTITVSASGANAGFVNFWKEEIFASDCSTVRGSDDDHTEYLFNILKLRQEEIQNQAKGAAQPHVYPEDLGPMLIPVADAVTQAKALEEWRVIHADVDRSKKTIADSFAELDSLVEAVYASNAPRIEVTRLSSDIQYGLSKKMNEGGIGYKIFRMNEIAHGRMVDNGATKYVDLSPEEFAKYRLHKGDLLFNRTNGSADHVGKVGMFTLDGDYCFASYLVRVVPDLAKVLPPFLLMMMNSPAFRMEVKGKAVKSAGQININATKMQQTKVPVLSLQEQGLFVAKVESIEYKISEAYVAIDYALARREEVMKKYL